jgi:hypothetical protein
MLDLTKKFLVVRTGGSIGEVASMKADERSFTVNGKTAWPLDSFDDKEEAKARAKERRSYLSQAEKKFYMIKYTVIENK